MGSMRSARPILSIAKIFEKDLPDFDQVKRYEEGSPLCRPVLLIDEAQEMQPEVLSELRLLSSTQLDSRSILTVVLSGDNRLLDLLRLPPLIPLGTRIGPRLALDYAAPKQLSELLSHLLTQAGHPRVVAPLRAATCCELAAGN